MIDFEKLKYADIEVVNGNPTPEELREISEFLKAHRAKHASAAGSRGKRARAIPRARMKKKTGVK